MNFHNVTVADEDVMKLADKMAADEALKIIDARKDESFFLAVGMVRPHVPFVVPDTIFDEYPYPDMELPYVEPGDLDDVPDIAEWESNANKYHMTGDEPQKAIQGYYASVTFMDQQVGRVLDKLEEYNLDNNTIIVFTSDHGYQLGQHTFWQKQSLFENAVRVPLIISSPFHKDTAGQRCNEVVELLDVYPTVADLAGLTWPEYLHGVSLKPLLAQPDGTGWTDKVAYTVTINGGKSIRTDRYRYNTWSNGAKELYDHDTDPDEFTNQADNPDYAADLASLDAILQTKITESGIIDPPAS